MKKGSLAKRAQHSYETRDKGGSSQSSALDWKKIEGTVTFYKPIVGKNRINIIPYTVKTKDHPLVRSKDMEIGDLDYVMDLWMHKSLGGANTDVICPKKTYGKACPACDAASKAYNDGDKQEGSKLKASRRVLYNIVDVNNPDAGVQVFDTSHFLFEKELIEAAREESSAAGEIVDFSDPDEGKTVAFRGSETQNGNIKFTEFKSFSFVDRSVDVIDDDLADAISFDEILKHHTPDEISKIMYGEDDEEGDEPAPAASGRGSRGNRAAKPPVDDDDDDDAPPADDPPPPARASRRGAPAAEPDPEPPKRASRRSTAQNDPDPDVAPARKSAAKKAPTQECPSGHEFGTDNDEFSECNTCPIWDACARAQTQGVK